MFKPELKYSRSGMPIISNEDIDTLGERMAVDFDHTSLFNPHPIDIERFVEKYLKMPVALLDACDEVWVFGEVSPGVAQEIEEAKRLKKQIRYFEEVGA